MLRASSRALYRRLVQPGTWAAAAVVGGSVFAIAALAALAAESVDPLSRAPEVLITSVESDAPGEPQRTSRAPAPVADGTEDAGDAEPGPEPVPAEPSVVVDPGDVPDPVIAVDPEPVDPEPVDPGPTAEQEPGAELAGAANELMEDGLAVAAGTVGAVEDAADSVVGSLAGPIDGAESAAGSVVSGD